MSSILGITGASGYIGRAILPLAAASGWQIVAIGRRPVESVQAWRFADLGSPPPEGLLDGLDAVLHLASNTDGSSPSGASEVVFARDLASQAAVAGILMIFASSQAAAVNAPSDYGRTKFAIEKEILPLGAVVVRPGLVVGGSEEGLFGSLVAFVRNSIALPDLIPRPVVQPIHVDDLAATMLTLCKRRDASGRIFAAAGEPIPFIGLLAGIARFRLRAYRIRLPVPLNLVRGVMVLASPLLGTRFSSSRLDSLVQSPALDADVDLAALGITLRPLADALDRRGRGVRNLLMEGRALARAVTGATPPPSLLRLYVHLLRERGQEEALHLPTSLLGRPAWLAALDTRSLRSNAPMGSLGWRMNAISRLAEAQPEMAKLFLMARSSSGKLVAAHDFILACIREIHSRLVALPARRAGKRWL